MGERNSRKSVFGFRLSGGKGFFAKVSVFLNCLPFQPTQRSSETHFQTTFCHFVKQIFPLPSPQTSPEPVNSTCFNNFLEANHVRYLPTPPISAPYRRTRTTVFSAGQSWCCPKNFCRALSGGGVRFGKLLGIICILKTKAAIVLMSKSANIP